LEKRIASNRPEKELARCFIENGETGIVPLHILFRADTTVRIRRIARRDKSGKSHPDTKKI
jgi:cytidylate kinase